MTAGHVHTLNFENLHQKGGCTKCIEYLFFMQLLRAHGLSVQFLSLRCVEMKNNQGQPCIKVVEIVIFIIIQIVHRV